MPLNRYRAPTPIPEELWHLTTPEAEYDHNFVYPVPDRLSTPGGIVVVPFVPSLHGEALFKRFLPHPEIHHWLPYGPFPTLASFLTQIEFGRANPQILTLAVFDQSLILPPCPEGVDDSTRPERIAGRISLTKADVAQRQAEAGAILLAPPFHRTHAMTHAGYLLIQYAFEVLHLRRLAWFAHCGNPQSPVAARRLGFKDEGIMRWEWVLPPGKDGLTTEIEGDVPGRHVFSLSMCWDDWRDGGKASLEKLVARQVVPRTLLS